MIVLARALPGLLSGALLLWLGSPVGAAADCRLRLDHPARIDIFSGESYEVYGQESVAVPVDFSVSADRSGCAFALGFRSTGARDGQRFARTSGARLAYRLSPDRRGTVRLKDLPAAQGAELLRGVTSGRAGRARGRYYIIVDEGQGAAAGPHQDRVQVSLIDLATGRRPSGFDSVLRFDVPSVLEARFRIDGSQRALGGYGHVVDFGALVTGLRRSLDFEVRANQGFSVTLSSENGGMLRRRGRESGRHGAIPYRLHIRGQILSLDRTVRLQGRAGLGAGRHHFPLVFEVGSTDRALAGSYGDVVRLTVAAD